MDFILENVIQESTTPGDIVGVSSDLLWIQVLSIEVDSVEVEFFLTLGPARGSPQHIGNLQQLFHSVSVGPVQTFEVELHSSLGEHNLCCGFEKQNSVAFCTDFVGDGYLWVVPKRGGERERSK